MKSEWDIIEVFLSEAVDDSDGDILVGSPNDDCAILDVGNQLIVLTTDSINSSPISFSLGLEDYRSLGRLLCAANISDLLSSGAEPAGLLVNIHIPDNAPVEQIEEIAAGVGEFSRRYECPLIGGDTKLQDNLVLSGMAVGFADNQSQLRLRNGAEPGDYVVLSGNIGDCFAATLALHREEVPTKLDSFVTDAILNPTLPLDINRQLIENNIGNGGIDVSDGLGGDLHRLAESSQVGLEIEAQALPISPEVREIADVLGLAPAQLAFGFGGDWEFIVTVPETQCGNIPSETHVIGRVKDESDCVLIKDGERYDLPDFAHDDFTYDGFVSELDTIEDWSA